MDDHTLSVLDYPRIRTILQDMAQTELGKSAFEELQPGLERAAIEREYALTEELLRLGEEPALSAVSDLGPFLEPGAEAILAPEDLLLIRGTLAALGKVHEYIKKRRSRLPGVADETAGIRAFTSLVAAIDQIVTDAGDIKDSATPELSRIRTRLRRLRNELVRQLETIAGASPDIFQDRSVGIRSGRFVLQLKSEARNRFDAVLHDTSDSGHTLFVEPLQLLPEQNELARLRSSELEEIQRILRTITSAVRSEAEALNSALAGVARLDELCARKRFAVRFDAVRPVISDRGVLQIIAARHPLLQLKKPDLVPLVFVLPDDTRVVLISGPNAGGKTVAMKTVGLFALLLSSGLFLPAGAGTELPLFRCVFGDIGDEQSLEGDLSSFSAHLLRTRQIIGQADADTLVLLDEIGGSTSPEEGSALAIAVFEELRNRGALTIATSHLGPLKAFVQTATNMANAAMEYKDRPTYRLLMGVPGESSALEIAASLGFPAGVLKQARNYLNQDWLNFSEGLKELTRERDQAQRLRLQLARDAEQTAAARKEWEQKQAALKQYEAAEHKRIAAEQAAMLRQARREIENLVRAIKESQASRESILAAKGFVEQELKQAGETEHAVEAAGEVAANPKSRIQNPKSHPAGGKRPVTGGERIAVGDYVHSDMLGRSGTVMEVLGDEASVAFGSIRIRVKLDDLELLSKPETQPQPEALLDEEDFDPRLNIHGMTQEDARLALERFMDRARLYSARSVSIMHGKGTGALRKLLWETLRRDKRVAEFRLGEPKEGGGGITFVTLKQ